MDGTLVYVTGITTGKGQMVVVDRTGEILDTVGPAEAVTRPFPELSPDDAWVLHAANTGDTREVYRYHLATRNRQRLTFNDLREGMATFHPNGRDIALYVDDGFTSFLHPLTGSGELRPLVGGIMAVITGDGSRVVYAKQREKGFTFDLVHRSAAGDEADVTIAATGGTNWFPQLSPDERFVAYTSDENGHDEVYVTTYPDPTARWQISTGGGSFARWRGDGKELYYTTRDAIHMVTVSTEGAFSFTPPEVLFRRPHIDWSSQWFDGFDVTGDGKRFVLFRPVLDETGGSPMMVVVQNWFEEFRPAAR
jgi:Tol biopolymer transport system component